MPLNGLTLLVVDDNEAHNYALSKSLQAVGANVISAHTGTETLHMARQKPDVVLLDVNLPDLNGFEVCRRLKADPETKDIAVIFISATYQDPNSKALAQSVGAETYLFHPVDKEQLLAIIQGQIHRSVNQPRGNAESAKE
jgi:two-component system, sensor histidine kinase